MKKHEKTCFFFSALNPVTQVGLVASVTERMLLGKRTFGLRLLALGFFLASTKLDVYRERNVDSRDGTFWTHDTCIGFWSSRSISVREEFCSLGKFLVGI